MLLLFDIDQTLITTHGCGFRAMRSAGRALFGERFTGEGVRFAGRLDPLIIAEMFEASGVARTPDNLATFRREYAAHLRRALDESTGASALPGVPRLLERLSGLRRGRESLLLGVLTGNFSETGAMKLRACGIEPAIFDVHAWGDASPHDPPAREHLVPVAMEAYAARTGRRVPAGLVTIIGDTPHDVACAAAHGCRSLGVATGQTSAEDLAGAGAGLVVRDLSDTGAVVRYLLGGDADAG